MFRIWQRVLSLPIHIPQYLLPNRIMLRISAYQGLLIRNSFVINSVTPYDFPCALSLYCYLHYSVESVNLFSLIFQIQGFGTSSSPFSLMYKFFAFALDRQLAEAGAHVVMAVRSTNRAQELIRKWQEEWSGKGLPLNIEVCCLPFHSSIKYG